MAKIKKISEHDRLADIEEYENFIEATEMWDTYISGEWREEGHYTLSGGDFDKLLDDLNVDKEGG